MSAILDELVAARVVVVPGSMFATTGHAVRGRYLKIAVLVRVTRTSTQTCKASVAVISTPG